MEEQNGVVDFILAASSDEELLKRFVLCKNDKELQKLFVEKGYVVSEADCKKLDRLKKDIGMMRWPLPPAY